MPKDKGLTVEEISDMLAKHRAIKPMTRHVFLSHKELPMSVEFTVIVTHATEQDMVVKLAKKQLKDPDLWEKI